MSPSDSEEDEEGRWRDFSHVLKFGPATVGFTWPWKGKGWKPAKWWDWDHLGMHARPACPFCGCLIGAKKQQEHEEHHNWLQELWDTRVTTEDDESGEQESPPAGDNGPDGNVDQNGSEQAGKLLR